MIFEGNDNDLETDPAAVPSVGFDAYHDRSRIETFVETPRFSGTCSKAAHWLCLGDTQGRGKPDTTPPHAFPLKSAWVSPLAKRFRQALTE